MNIPLIVYKDLSNTYISEIERLRGQVTVARHVHDIGELLGIAQTGIVQAALIIDVDGEVTTSSLKNLHNFGVATVVVQDQGPFESRIGEKRISTLSGIEEIIEAIRTAVLQHEDTVAPIAAENQEPNEEPVDSKDSDFSQINGQAIVFWGSAGAPGRTTFTCNLASAVADKGYRVCILDADTYNPSVFALLGMTEDYSTLSQLAHLAEHGSLDSEAFLKTVSTIRHRNASFDVATGIINASRWSEVRQPAFEMIIEVACETYDFVFIDINHLIEADEEITFEGIAPRRNGCTISALEKADHLFILGNGDAIGIPRLIKTSEQLADSFINLKPEVNLHLWINKVRDSATGNSPLQQLERAWQNYNPLFSIEGFIPWEPETFDRSLLTGQTISELAIGRKQSELPKTLELMMRPLIQDKSEEEQEKSVSAAHQPEIIVKRKQKSQTKTFNRIKSFLPLAREGRNNNR